MLAQCSPARPLAAVSRVGRPTAGLKAARPSVGRRSRASNLAVRAGPTAGESPDGPFQLAPSKPKTPFGEMLQYYLTMEPQLFHSAVESRLEALAEERTAEREKQAEQAEQPSTSDSSEMVLYSRMRELKIQERSTSVEDLMYMCVLERFIRLGVPMLPKMDDLLLPDPLNLRLLTEALHSVEALDMVREHMLSMMGPAATAPPSVMVKISKFQMAQVYAASAMFGYFLRRVDKRFQLERAMGTLPESMEDAVSRLEYLFSQADEFAEGEVNPDWADADSVPPMPDMETTSIVKTPKSALRQYVEAFDQDTLVEMTRLVSCEGAALVQRQTFALFGDLKELQQQMQDAVGMEQVGSIEEYMEAVQAKIGSGDIESLTMTVQTQRHVVLEAVAFGTFLRDTETWVDDEYGLLTALPLPPSMGGAGPEGPEGYIQ